MNSVKLFYFSGTGNTKLVTEMLKSELEKKQVMVTIEAIDACIKSNKELSVSELDTVGICYPIMGFGSPRIINEFIKFLPRLSKKKLFILKTAADFIGINHNASARVIKKLEQKGYDVFYDRIIAMGSNWLVEYDDDLVKQLYITAKEKVKHMSKELLEGRKRRYSPKLAVKLMTPLINWFEDEIGGRLFGRLLTVKRTCTKCKLCVMNCPVQNISLKNNGIEFGWKCIWCMKCIYLCPNKSITSRGFKFTILKRGYDVKRIVNDPQIKGEYINEKTEDFMGHFYDYMNDPSI
ncbi:MAG: EFR1 family ferrodoxin [Clostridia bacterium]|nr:EFR1 family ferrodoxin [Clostridia bacterium]